MPLIALAHRKPKKAKAATATTTRPPVLASYTHSGFLTRHKRIWLTLLILAAISYGFLFALGTTYILVQLAIPLVAVAILVIALLRETGKTYPRVQEWALFAFLIGLLCWPDYIAIALPGMPWITVLRLTTIPLAAVFLLNLSQSSVFRGELSAILGAAPAVTKFLLLTTVVALVSIAFSAQTGFSANKFVVFLLSCVVVFFVSAFVFSKPGRVIKLSRLIWAVTVLLCLVAFQEKRHEVIPWAEHIPGFLKIDPLTLNQILSSKARAATGAYRVQSKFTTPLSFAEFLALAVPFIIHAMVTARGWIVRLAALGTIVLIVYTIILTDSRLGFVGLFLAILIYLLAWGALRWKRDPSSMFGPAVVMSYPALFTSFIVATFFVGRLRALVWGTGAQASSTEGRTDQLAMGLPMVLKHPWGYGLGRAAETLGYRDEDLLTIDSYYLSVALELGIIGFIVYYSIFLSAIWKGGRVVLSQYDDNNALLIPVLIALINFVVIKSILSQQENHPFAFLLLGVSVGLTYLIKRGADQATAPSASLRASSGGHEAKR